MDIRLCCIDTLKGEPLIMLHGNGGSKEYFNNQIAYFMDKYRVIAPDTRGHGQSPRGEGEFSIGRFAEDLRELMDDKGIESAHILGFSDGGNIALYFALRYPHRVRSLILNGANLNPSGVKDSFQRCIELSYKLTGKFAEKSENARHKAELLGLMVNEPNIDPTSLYYLRIPTLVIVGTRDLIKLNHSRMICASLPNAQLVMIKGDHCIASKNPAVFNQEVEKFLREQHNSVG